MRSPGKPCGDASEARRGKVDLDRALRCFEKAIEAEPASALARANYTMAAVVKFYTVEASLDLLQKSRASGPGGDPPQPGSARSASRSGRPAPCRGRPAGSREQSLEAIELGDRSQGPLQSVASTTKLLGRPDLSISWLKIAQLFQENPADYEYQLAGAWAALGEDERAEKIYERVFSLHPDLPEGWMGICELRLLEGSFDKARQIYQEKLSIFTEFPAAKQMSAQVEFFGRNWTEAERLTLDLLATDPSGSMDYGTISFQSVWAACGKSPEIQTRPTEFFTSVSS